MTTGNRSFQPGKWGIISASFKASPDGAAGEAELFVNGYQKVAAEIPLRPDRSRGATRLNIGRHGSGERISPKGDIREIVIYDRALTEQEHYQAIRYLATEGLYRREDPHPLYRKWLSYSPDSYQAFGIAFRIPSTGKLVAIQRQGLSHVGGSVGEVRQWESTDRGATWTNRLTYDSQYDDRNVGGGLSFADGKHPCLFCALRRRQLDRHASPEIGRRCPNFQRHWRTSADQWLCRMFSPYGPMVELPSGRLLQTFYGGDCRKAQSMG